MHPIYYGIIAMLGFGLNNAIAVVPARRLGSVKGVFFRNIFTTLFLLIASMFIPGWKNLTLPGFTVAFIIAVIGYIPLMTFFMALSRNKVGVIAPIANSSVIFTVLFSVFFFGESLSYIQMMAIGVIVAGIILVSVDFRDLKNSKIFAMSSGIPFALITCLLWGVVFAVFRIPVQMIGPIMSSLIIEFGGLVCAGIQLALKKESFLLPTRKLILPIAMIGLTGAIAMLSFNYGVQSYDTSIIAAIALSNPLVSSLFGHFVFKERLSAKQWASMTIIVLGIIALSLLQ